MHDYTLWTLWELHQLRIELEEQLETVATEMTARQAAWGSALTTHSPEPDSPPPKPVPLSPAPSSDDDRA